MRFLVTTICVAGLLGACGAIPTATMKVSPSLRSSADVAEISGLTLKLSGTYNASRYSGDFTRSASGSSWLGNLTSSDEASSSFTLRSQDHPDAVQARCSFGQSSLNVGVIEIETKKFGYNCTFSSLDATRNGNLQLAKKAAGLIDVSGKNVLTGAATVAGVSLQIVSVHEAEGGLIPVEMPLGYEFFQAGRAVGAVSLASGTPQIHFLQNLTPAEHVAVATTAVALGLFMIPSS